MDTPTPTGLIYAGYSPTEANDYGWAPWCIGWTNTLQALASRDNALQARHGIALAAYWPGTHEQAQALTTALTGHHTQRQHETLYLPTTHAHATLTALWQHHDTQGHLRGLHATPPSAAITTIGQHHAIYHLLHEPPR
jgi:hypothetical protein